MKFKLLILPLLFLACKNDSQHSNATETVLDNVETNEFESNSLGYPSYYTHPELKHTEALKSILEKSDKVLAYNYNKGQENPAMMGDDNQYLYSLETGERIDGAYNETKLQTENSDHLIDLLSDSTNYSGQWSGLAGVCYIPHVGFGFFKHDSLIAQVSVCFMCQGIRTNPLYKSDGLSSQGSKKFEAFIKGIGLEVVH